MRCFAIILSLLMSSLISYSQASFSLGVRVGNFNGIDYKQFFSPKQDFALQLILNTKEVSASNGQLSRFTGFIEKQTILSRSSRTLPALSLFYGFGGHYGYGYYYEKVSVEDIITEKIETGLDATIGLEAKFMRFPILVAVDFSPYYNYKDIEDENFWLNMGVSVRYVFGNSAKK